MKKFTLQASSWNHQRGGHLKSSRSFFGIIWKKKVRKDDWFTHLTLAAPKPPIISTNSDPFIAKNGTLPSVATAFASKVFPHPGGPSNKAPFGT